MTNAIVDGGAQAADSKANAFDGTAAKYVKAEAFTNGIETSQPTPSEPTKVSKKVVIEEKNGEEEEASDDENGQDTPLDEEKIKAAMGPEGMEKEVKLLYLGKEGVDGAEHEWVDRMPMAMSMKAAAISAKQRERAKFAVLVRMELRPKARFTEDNPVQIHSLVVQSPLIRETLNKVFDGHANFNAAEDQPQFEKPLKPFVHRWNQLQEAAKTEEDPETKEHLNLLIDAISAELTGTLSTRDLCIQRDSITFNDLWMIFEPGKLIVATVDKTECAYKLIKAETVKNERGTWFVLECICTDWDGENFGKATISLAIGFFNGSAKISSLAAVPLEVHRNREDLTKMLKRRGERFQELSMVKCMVYRGTAIDRSDPCEPRKIYVDGRIVLDADSYIRYNPGQDVTIKPLKESSESYEERDFWSRYSRHRGFSQFEKKDAIERDVLTPDQVLTCRHLVRGFSLKLKMWLDFQIEGVNDVVWNDTAFERLILPGDHKNLLLAFAKGQRDSDEEFDDIIEGKGKGMIIQLNGPPGVGKTLTAEAVAETMHVPLYTISAGDLGVNPEVVQMGLSNAFQLARNWSAVLLLDEADVFMEKRTTHDLTRNQLVSLFLQSLEYYQGTLFLTTNRVETFDQAFESRVHISIHYDDLTPDSRREVWKNFLQIPKSGSTSKNTGENKISDSDIEEFVKIDLNGRQIKNVVKSASLLALSEKGPLNSDHVRTVLRIKMAEKAARYVEV